MYSWMVFLHVVGVLGAMLAHGTVMMVTMWLPREKDPERIRQLLLLARNKAVIGMFYASLILLLLAGVGAGFSGDWWGSWWIWVSLALFVVIVLAMGFMGRGYFDRIHAALGDGSPGESVDQAKLEAAVARAPVVPLVIVGIGGILVILWLMMFKPF